MKLLICGGRDYDDYATMKSVVMFRYDLKDLTIVSGGARGADKLAEELAKQLGVPNIIMKADWDKWGKSAGFIRNIDMLNISDEVLAFWDRESKGTKHTIDNADKKGMVCQIVYY